MTTKYHIYVEKKRGIYELDFSISALRLQERGYSPRLKGAVAYGRDHYSAYNSSVGPSERIHTFKIRIENVSISSMSDCIFVNKEESE